MATRKTVTKKVNQENTVSTAISSIPKFQQILNSDHLQIKQSRSEIIFQDFKSEQEELVRNLENDVRQLQKKLMNLTDIYPESSLSLMVTKPDIDAKQWVKEIQSTKVSLEIKQRELDIAKSTQNEWFN